MEQETAFTQQTHTHLLVQAHTRSRLTSARRHACMKNWKNKNPSSGLDGTRNIIHSETYTHLLVQAHGRSRMTSARRHACMKNWKNKNPSSGLDRTRNSIHSANIHTSARASTSSLTYDECSKACMYEKLKSHTKTIIRARYNNKKHLFRKHTHICSCRHTLAHV